MYIKIVGYLNFLLQFIQDFLQIYWTNYGLIVVSAVFFIVVSFSIKKL